MQQFNSSWNKRHKPNPEQKERDRVKWKQMKQGRKIEKTYRTPSWFSEVNKSSSLLAGLTKKKEGSNLKQD